MDLVKRFNEESGLKMEIQENYQGSELDEFLQEYNIITKTDNENRTDSKSSIIQKASENSKSDATQEKFMAIQNKKTLSKEKITKVHQEGTMIKPGATFTESNIDGNLSDHTEKRSHIQTDKELLFKQSIVLPESNKISLEDTKRVVLPEQLTYKDYVEFIDRDAPYGKDPTGQAYLFPQPPNQKALRMDMPPKSDWTKFHKSGWGWQMKRAFIFIIIFYIIPQFLFPTMFVVYGHPEVFNQVFSETAVAIIPFMIIFLALTWLIQYGTIRIEDLLKPYGKFHKSFEVLWKDELEYLKFVNIYYRRTTNWKWLVFGFLGFLYYAKWFFVPLIIIHFNISPTYIVQIPNWTYIG